MSPDEALRELAGTFGENIIKYAGGMRECAMLLVKQEPRPPPAAYRPWQIALRDRLLLPYDGRTIIYVLGKKGGEGKSTMIDIISHEIGGTVVGGTKKDAATIWSNAPKRCCILDISRSRHEYSQGLMGFMENIADRRIIVEKYQSRCFEFSPAWPIIFSNHEPPVDMFSADRLELWELTPPQKPHMPEMGAGGGGSPGEVPLAGSDFTVQKHYVPHQPLFVAATRPANIKTPPSKQLADGECRVPSPKRLRKAAMLDWQAKRMLRGWHSIQLNGRPGWECSRCLDRGDLEAARVCECDMDSEDE